VGEGVHERDRRCRRIPVRRSGRAKQRQTRQIKAFRINFASGFEIMALSSAPRSLRGKQGLLIIDEAAFVDSLAQLLKAAMAFLIWGGKVVVVSTHNGVDNPFNELLDEIRSEKKQGQDAQDQLRRRAGRWAV
jgi:phage FluMu gp28-like protein